MTAPPVAPASGIGASPRRADALPKATGTFAYASDLRRDGMLWGVTVRSPYPSAVIRRVDTARARSLAGVAAILVHDDVPDNVAAHMVQEVGDAGAAIAAAPHRLELDLSLIHI